MLTLQEAGEGREAGDEDAKQASSAPAGSPADTEDAANQTQEQSSEDPDGDGLDQAEEKQVQELAQRDREVRAHEQAHARVGGQYAGAPSYTYQQGPDGKRYAIGGEVSIDTSAERTPEATIRKMQIVIRAATAPADPSSQDLKVAQQARAALQEAQAEARQQRAEELGGDEDESAPGQSNSVSEPDGAGQTDSSSRDETGRGGGDRSAARAIAAYQAATENTGLFQGNSGFVA